MAVTNNATLIEGFEGAGPVYTSIGSGQGAANNTDVFIAGAQSGARRSSNASVHGFFARASSAVDISGSGEHVKFFLWVTHYAVLTAMEVRIGHTSTAYETHSLTVAEYPALGGWWPVWVEVDSGSDTGTPDFTIADEFGVAISLPAVGGNAPNNIMDQVHHVTRPVMTWDGATGAFSDFASTDTTNALGTLIDLNGVLFLYANLQIGSSTSTTFTDSGVVVVAPEFSHLPSASTWQGIDIDLQHASTVITWTDSVFAASDPTGATRKPDLLVTGTSGSAILSRNRFDGLRTIELTSGVTMEDCVIANSGVVDATTAGTNGADLSGTSIIDSTVAADASSLIWNVNADPDGEMDNMTFTKGAAAHHAIAFGTTSPLTMTVRGITSNSFNATDAQNDSFFHVLRTSGTVTINVIGGTGNFSFKSAGATVLVVLDPVTTTIRVKDNNDANLQNARVLVEAGDGTGDLPFEDSVTITHVTTTATVSHTAHGLDSGDKVVIRGADQQPYNGIFAISNVSANAYDYTMGSDPGTNATGTITSTGVVVEGLTNASGEASASKAFSVDQNVRGVVRKASASPFFKLVDFTDVVDKDTGLTKTVQVILDE